VRHRNRLCHHGRIICRPAIKNDSGAILRARKCVFPLFRKKTAPTTEMQRQTHGKILILRGQIRACVFVTEKSNPNEEIRGTAGHICPLTERADKRIAEDENTSGKSCPIQSRILNSNFKTGAINRSATPPSGAFTIANSLLHYFTTPSQIRPPMGLMYWSVEVLEY
jgi:hypothetical protein